MQQIVGTSFGYTLKTSDRFVVLNTQYIFRHGYIIWQVVFHVGASCDEFWSGVCRFHNVWFHISRCHVNLSRTKLERCCKFSGYLVDYSADSRFTSEHLAA